MIRHGIFKWQSSELQLAISGCPVEDGLKKRHWRQAGQLRGYCKQPMSTGDGPNLSTNWVVVGMGGQAGQLNILWDHCLNGENTSKQFLGGGGVDCWAQVRTCYTWCGVGNAGLKLSAGLWEVVDATGMAGTVQRGDSE